MLQNVFFWGRRIKAASFIDPIFSYRMIRKLPDNPTFRSEAFWLMIYEKGKEAINEPKRR